MTQSTPPDIERACRNCWFVRTFTPRFDEQERYGFGETGYGCRFPNYEGYTRANSTCPSFRARSGEAK